MYTVNNFNTSSTGLNIELTAFCDTYASRLYFEEMFFTIKEGSKDQLVYSEGNYSTFEKEYIFTKAELVAAYIDYMGQGYNKQSFNNDLRTYWDFPTSKATKQDLIDFIKNDLYEEYEWHNFCKKAGFKANFDIVVSRGYSQGDYKEVIVPHKFWECIGVEKPDCVQSNLGNTIDNLLWDCPICCRFTVNDEEFYIDQELKDCYSWDKSEALEIVKKLIEKDYTQEQQAVIISFLSSALKTELGYQ